MSKTLQVPDKKLKKETETDFYPDASKLFTRVCGEVNGLKEYLLGEVLTIIDASFTGPQQRKAVKDLVKNAIHKNEYFTSNIQYEIRWFAEAKKLPFIWYGGLQQEEVIQESPYKKKEQ